MKKSWKKVLAAALTLMMVLALFGCGSGGDGDKTSEKDNAVNIGLVISTQDNPFFVDLQAGAKAKADELGANLIALDSNNDSTKEMTNVEDLINQGVDLIMINPVDSDAVGNAVAAANDAKIPVVTLDRSATSGEVVTHIASDNVAGGQMAGEFILEQLGGSGKVVELEGIPGASATRDRGEGFHKAVDGKLDIVAKQTAQFDRSEGMSVMEDMLQSQPEIQAVFAHNDEMALGALEAIKASGREIMVVGFDATDDALAAIKAGDMAATVQQLPKEIGAMGVDSAVKIIKGETVDEFIPVDLQLVTKENVE